MAALEIVAGQTKGVVLLMNGVNAMDATGLVALESALEPLQKHHCLAILSGVCAQPMALLKKAHLDTTKGVVLCASPREAFARATAHVAAERPADAEPRPAAQIQA